MDNIKFEVTSEIKRLSRKYIILIELLKIQYKGIKYLHHSAKRYFNLRYNDLEDKILK